MVAVACSLLLSGATGLPVPLGDAGTGADAGDSRGDALPLAYGAYEGNLTPQDADWYTFPAGAGLGCADLTVSASTAMRFGLGSGDALTTGLADDGLYHTTLATVGAIDLGILPDEDPWSVTSVGPYSFALSHAPPSAIGDQRRYDAASTVAGASPVPDECFRAVFKHDGPDVDVWTFNVSTADIVTYSLAVGPGAVGALEILGPDGTRVAGPIGSGEAGQFVATEPGTYAVRTRSVVSWDTSDYVVALVVGPDPSTCRPYCLGLA